MKYESLTLVSGIFGHPKQYATKEERMAAMEKILIEMANFKDSRGLRMVLPWGDDILNIYMQAEA